MTEWRTKVISSPNNVQIQKCDITDTDIWSVRRVLRVWGDSEAVSEEGVDLVTGPDPLPRVSVTHSLTVPW